MLVMTAAAMISMRGRSKQSIAAKDHTAFAMACGPNSGAALTIIGAIAITGRSWNPNFAIAQTALLMLRGGAGCSEKRARVLLSNGEKSSPVPGMQVAARWRAVTALTTLN